MLPSSTCMSNICPTAGIASIVSEQGPIYCDAKATGPAAGGATATATVTGAVGTGTATGPGATGTGASTTTAKSGGSGGVMFPLAGGVVAGLIGVAAVVL